MSYRLGVDVGGTFTDLLLIDETTSKTFRVKTPSTPADQSEGVLAGIAKICQNAGIAPSKLTSLMHGTTVATNAVLEGKGAKVGLIVTDGYRQVLHVGRSFVPGGLAGWIIWQKPETLATLENTVEVKERIGAKGDVVRKLDEASVRRALKALAAKGVEAITVSLINAFANDKHEKRIREIAEKELPKIPISLSCEILPEMREYERALTTVANSYVRPTVSKYLESLESECRKRNINARLRVLRSDGGLMAFESAKRAPVNLLMSGPAGGVNGAIWAARQAGFDDLLTFDMGGTSTDVALVENGEARLRRETAVGNVTVRASSLDVRTVGAGGGSIAKVPELTRALRVGPESAGAVPGPAAYGKGGVAPTVTDANVALGYLPEGLLGGEMPLDRAAATKAVQGVADALGVGLVEAAQGIVDIVNENMFGALRLVSVEQGYDPRDFALVAFGGAGPLHANALGILLGCWPVIIPPSPGVLCAYGDATTKERNEASRTFIRPFSGTTHAEVSAMLDDLKGVAAATLDTEGVPRADQTVVYQVDVRYHGQGLELPIVVDIASFTKGGLDHIAGLFDDTHRRLFTFGLEAEKEIVNLRAIVQGKAARVESGELAKGSDDPSAARASETTVWVNKREVKAPVYARAKLLAGNKIAGPAIVTEMDSTTLILPDHVGEVHASGNILIRPLAR
jgi:N-methylhydantoinase A